MDCGREWRVSSYSGANNNCVEVALDRTAVGIRDTKDLTAGYLAIEPAAWTAFLAAVSGRK
jgi:hypothetical protein